MRLSRLFSFPRKLSPAWIYAPGAAIWRMLPTSEGYLVGESRDDGKKQVRFFCLELETGRRLWENVSVAEDWWVGIEAVHGGMLFLHMFARPDMPEHAGIVALDLTTGTVLWNMTHLQLRGAKDDTLFVRDHRDPDAPAAAVSVRTGEPLGDSAVMDAASGGFGDPAGITYPAPLQKGDAGWPAFERILGRRSLIGTCETVRVEDRWIFSYHAAQLKQPVLTTFEHLIAVADLQGRKLFEETLHREAHMPVYDAFFVHGSHAYFIRHERELVCVGISGNGK